MEWTDTLSRKARKNIRLLPKRVRKSLAYLIREIELTGPVKGSWTNYSKLGMARHHCHLKKGNPTYVAVWEVKDKKMCLIEVIYAGTHEKYRTEKIELHFIGPAGKKAAAISALTQLGFVAAQKGCKPSSWRDSFPELQDNEAGVILAGARYREGLTQRELAYKTGIPQRHISEMENGKRPIGKKNAKALANVLNADYRAFL